MAKKNISSDFKDRDGQDPTQPIYEPVTTPSGYYADLYRNAQNQLEKMVILQAHDFAYAESLSGAFISIEQREQFKLNSFIKHLKFLGFEISRTEEFRIQQLEQAFTLPLDLGTSLEMDTDKSYRRVRKKVNFISTASLKELFLMTDDVIDSSIIPFSIRKTVSSNSDNDKVILLSNKTFSFLINLQDLFNKNDNRSFAIERFFVALVDDFETFHSTAKEEDIYDIKRIASLIIAESVKSKSSLEEAYKELYEYLELTPKSNIAKKRSGFNLDKEPDDVRMLFTYNNDVAIKFKDELFYSELVSAV